MVGVGLADDADRDSGPSETAVGREAVAVALRAVVQPGVGGAVDRRASLGKARYRPRLVERRHDGSGLGVEIPRGVERLHRPVALAQPAREALAVFGRHEVELRGTRLAEAAPGEKRICVAVAAHGRFEEDRERLPVARIVRRKRFELVARQAQLCERAVVGLALVVQVEDDADAGTVRRLEPRVCDRIVDRPVARVLHGEVVAAHRVKTRLRDAAKLGFELVGVPAARSPVDDRVEHRSLGAQALLHGGHHHSFTLPITIPFTKCRWRKG